MKTKSQKVEFLRGVSARFQRLAILLDYTAEQMEKGTEYDDIKLLCEQLNAVVDDLEELHLDVTSQGGDK